MSSKLNSLYRTAAATLVMTWPTICIKTFYLDDICWLKKRRLEMENEKIYLADICRLKKRRLEMENEKIFREQNPQ